MHDINDDDDLDDLLRRARPEPTAPASRAARELAAHIAADAPAEASRPRSRRRRRGLVAGLTLGALALTGAGSLTAYQLSIPPFVQMDDQDARTDRIAVDMVTRDGTPVRCGTYLDYRGLSDAQETKLRTFVSGTDWRGLGQRHYDALSAAEKSGEVQGSGLASRRAADEVVQRAQRAVPGLTYLAPHGSTITMSSVSCDYPKGAPQ